jgi:hypothetical protein
VIQAPSEKLSLEILVPVIQEVPMETCHECGKVVVDQMDHDDYGQEYPVYWEDAGIGRGIMVKRKDGRVLCYDCVETAYAECETCGTPMEDDCAWPSYLPDGYEQVMCPECAQKAGFDEGMEWVTS